MWLKQIGLALSGLLILSSAHAHIASNGFLNINIEGATVSGTLELAMRDGEVAVGLDDNGDSQVSWGELRLNQPKLNDYVQSHLYVSTATRPCRLIINRVQVNARVDGNYLWLPFNVNCSEQPDQLRIDYRLLTGVDPSHRGLLTLIAWGTTQTAVLGGKQTLQTFKIGQPTQWRAFTAYLSTGIWHIWTGIDHLLFLLSLLLPAVLLRKENHWQPVLLARPAFVNILKVVTAFTLAHSLTLSLAAFNIIRLPSRLTESVIAASIIVAALNNLFPKVTEGRWRIAFLFGLLHGFGFASVLADMGLPSNARLLSLVAFNLGVELGQLAVVLAVMPLAYTLRATSFYRRGVIPLGSSAIAALALVWLVQRARG